MLALEERDRRSWTRVPSRREPTIVFLQNQSFLLEIFPSDLATELKKNVKIDLNNEDVKGKFTNIVFSEEDSKDDYLMEIIAKAEFDLSNDELQKRLDRILNKSPTNYWGTLDENCEEKKSEMKEVANITPETENPGHVVLQ